MSWFLPADLLAFALFLPLAIFGGKAGLFGAIFVYLAVHMAALFLQPLAPINAPKGKLPALLIVIGGLLLLVLAALL